MTIVQYYNDDDSTIIAFIAFSLFKQLHEQARHEFIDYQALTTLKATEAQRPYLLSYSNKHNSRCLSCRRQHTYDIVQVGLVSGFIVLVLKIPEKREEF